MELHARVMESQQRTFFNAMSVPKIVAHRGYAAKYPENTLLSISQALKLGVPFVEFDVQLSADGVPVLHHDVSLERTCDIDQSIFELKLSELQMIQACETKRFARKYLNMGIGIPTLQDVIYMLKNWPHAQAFVELKEESLAKHGIEKTIKTILKTIAPALDQCVIISYHGLAIRCARAMGAKKIGWVIDEWSDSARSTATELAPDYLFCNYRKVPFKKGGLWPGPWEWALYEVTNPELAIGLHNNGVDLVESMDIEQILNHPRFQEEGGNLGGYLL